MTDVLFIFAYILAWFGVFLIIAHHAWGIWIWAIGLAMLIAILWPSLVAMYRSYYNFYLEQARERRSR